MKNKKKLIIVIISIILFVGILAVVMLGLLKWNSNVTEQNTNKLSFSDYLSTNDLEKSNIKVKKIENPGYDYIMDKYAIIDIYVTEDYVEYEGLKGKMLYLRANENENYNVYQVEYKLDSANASNQISQYMDEFKRKMKKYLKLADNARSVETDFASAETEGIDGLDTIEDIMYKAEGRIYTVYEAKDESGKIKKYDMNFYVKNGNLRCEFTNSLL